MLLLDQPGRERCLWPKLRRLSRDRDVLRRATLNPLLRAAYFA
jgi:hypothetical protein